MTKPTPATITCSGHGLQPGDLLTITGMWQPWYVRFWRWLTRYKPPAYRVSDVTQSTLNIEPPS